MNHQSLRRLVLSALFAALACIATLVIQLHVSPNGYINLGDCIVLLCGWLLSPAYGAAAAGIGSAMADILSGYAYYAPATLVVKALMALLGGMAFRAVSSMAGTGFWPPVFSAPLFQNVSWPADITFSRPLFWG